MATLIKHLHVWLVILSLGSFVLRFIWTQKNSAYLREKWVRVAAPAVDALLLLTGAALAVLNHFSPVAVDWLGLKLLGIVVYVALGTVALKAPLSRLVRHLVGGLALTALLIVIFLAVYKPIFT